MVDLKSDTAVGTGDIVQQLLAVLTDEWLLVITSNIVPCDPVVVNVVEHGQTRFVGSVDVKLSVVGLSRLLVSGRTPRVVAPAGRYLSGGSHAHPGG